MSKSDRERTIFVSIASYRDKTCDKTVQSLLENAEFPDRIFIGTCEQNDLQNINNEQCVSWNDPLLVQRYRQIRRIMISHQDAEGPCYARYLCSLLYKNEDYFMQIDAHSLLVKHWDSKCIQTHNSLPDPSSKILSYYPNPEDQYAPHPPTTLHIPVIRSWNMNNDGVIQWDAAQYSELNSPVPSPYIAAGFFFAPGPFVKKVPYDPQLPYLFMGEELLITMRAYTSGYDIYTPSTPIIFHRYQRHDEPSVYVDNASRVNNQQALDRVKRLTGLHFLKNQNPDHIPPTVRDDPYSLGTQRSCDDYLRLIGFLKDPNTSIPTTKESFAIMTNHAVIRQLQVCKNRMHFLLFVVAILLTVLILIAMKSDFFIRLFSSKYKGRPKK